jgi:hypothetical protein
MSESVEASDINEGKNKSQEFSPGRGSDSYDDILPLFLAMIAEIAA